MKYTATQIEKAKIKYNEFLVFKTINNYDLKTIGRCEAEKRADFHNDIVKSILNGDKAVEKEWKLFFLDQEIEKDEKELASKKKIEKNKKESENVLQPIKEIRKITDFNNWLKKGKHKFTSQFYSKKYTAEAVDAFLAALNK